MKKEIVSKDAQYNLGRGLTSRSKLIVSAEQIVNDKCGALTNQQRAKRNKIKNRIELKK